MGGKEPTFVAFFLPEYISGQAVDLLSPILESSCLCLKANTSLMGTIRAVKDMSKFSPRRGIQRCCQGKLFSMIVSQGASFLRKKWCCAIGANLNTFLARLALIATPIPNVSGVSLIEQDVIWD